MSHTLVVSCFCKKSKNKGKEEAADDLVPPHRHLTLQLSSSANCSGLRWKSLISALLVYSFDSKGQDELFLNT